MKRLVSVALLTLLVLPMTLAAEEYKAGLLARVYYQDGEINSLSQFSDAAEPNSSQIVSTIKIGSSQDLASLTGGRSERVAVRFFGKLKVEQAGEYTLFLSSDDGSRMLIGGKQVIDNDGLHANTEKHAKLQLDAGLHDLVVDYFNNTGGAACVVSWQAPGGAKQVIPAAALLYNKADEPKLPEPAKFEIGQGQRITLIGNTLAERMQHDGWLEAMLQKRFADKQLVVRNLGFSADAVDQRLRVDGYGSQDEWLNRTQADTIFVFFGFNESFEGEEGLSKFKNGLTGQVRGLLSKSYNGESAPSIVLFSPNAFENLDDPNLPDGKEINENLKLYSEAVAEVAKQTGVKFVDLFTPTLAAYEKAKEPLTINGIHLNEAGNRVVAEIIDGALFDEAAPKSDEAVLAKLRAAIQDKNLHWFNRYQPTDGFNVHGGRSGLSYNGISNRQVMDRENEILEVMTANRDKAIWAAANGKSIKVDDGNTPEFIEVKTNLPGPLPGGKHKYSSGEDAIKDMTVGKNMKVSLFASEEDFPELINPVQMAFDTKGRLWVAAWPSYTRWKPKDEMEDKLLILEDTNGDGRADKCKTFATGLQNPTGFEFYNGGVLVACAPDLWFLKDTDGDDVADVRERVLHGLSSGDTHHAANSMVIDPGGAVYFQEGTFHRTQIETPYGPLRNMNGCVWRFEPNTFKVNRHVPYGFANPHGHVYDRWGQGFVHDGTGAVPYHETLFSGHLDFPAAHGGCPTLYNKRTRPCAATEILSSDHFPEEMQGNLLVLNVIGMQGMLQYKFRDDGASFQADETEVIVQSSDRNFRPVDVEIGPDGAIWFTDWTNAIVGHMQHHIRDPNRDDEHGRVYRITYEGRPLSQEPDMTELTIEQLLEQLKQHNDRTRYRAKIELSSRPSKDVIAATKKWLGGLDKDHKDYEHHRLEGLWVHQYHNTVDVDLLKQVLASKDHRARAAATKVLCYWRDRVDEPLKLLQQQVNDEHPLVRLEAVRALSFFRTPEAGEIATEVLIYPMDKYLEYTLNETNKQLNKFSK